MLRNLRTPAIVSSVLVLPFVILELINRRSFHEGFPIELFGLMWLLSLSFILIVMPIVRTQPAGNRKLAIRSGLLPRVALSILIAWLWVGLVLDQMPCSLAFQTAIRRIVRSTAVPLHATAPNKRLDLAAALAA